MTGTDVLFRFGTDISAIREANEKIVKGVEEAARNSKKSWMEFYATLTMVGHGVRRLAQMFSSAWSQAARLAAAATRLAPLIGGLEQSKSLCEELRDQAANGTQSFEQLASVAGRLASVFKSTDNVRRWTKAFHDISAGTGLDVNELLGNFTKAKASGRFEAGFLDMFAQKGVNLYEPLAKELGMSEAEIRKMAQTGELEFGRVSAAILATTEAGGRKIFNWKKLRS